MAKEQDQTVIDEILKFDPGKQESGDKDSRIDEILKFDPARVGGTYQPAVPPIPGATPPISTITGKPVTEYVPGEEPEASFKALIKASFVDEPEEKIRVFAQERGISPRRYRIDNKGNIIFQTDAGGWQRESGELGFTRFKELAAATIGHPGTYLGTVGAIFGPSGAVEGAVAGELIRQAAGAYLYGGHKDPTKNIMNAGLEGAFALLGEGASKVIKNSTNKFLRRGAISAVRGREAPLYYGGRELAQGLLTKQDHAKAAFIKSLADKHGIELLPHQLYDKKGMSDVWAYLRKHPTTSTAIKEIEKQLADQTDEALDAFIKDLGGDVLTPYQTGRQLQQAAKAPIKQLERARAAEAGPLYKAAFETPTIVDVTPVMETVDNLMGETVPGDPAYAALSRIKKMLEYSEGDPRKLHRVKMTGIDNVLRKAKAPAYLKREMTQVKTSLKEIMQESVPGYTEANLAWAEWSRPIDKLKEGVIGQIADLSGDKAIAGASDLLLKWKNIRSPDLLRQAKAIIQPQDPVLWNRMIGNYIRDTWQDLVIRQDTGEVANAAGAMYKALFGREGSKQREILRAALDKDRFKALDELMQVFQRAGVGIGRESSETFMFQEMNRQLGGKAGALRQLLQSTKETIAGWTFGAWDEAIRDQRLMSLISALTAPDALNQIRKMKSLTPGSRKLIDAFAVFTSGLIGTVYGEQWLSTPMLQER